MKLVVAVIWMCALGCKEPSAGAPARPAMGVERGDCRADKTCDPGLLCLSNLCVRPPPADCAAVAEHVTSLDLGNYAEVEERVPHVEKYRAACETAMLTKEQGACIEAANATSTAKECAPTMFPKAKADEASNPGDCGAVVSKVRSAMAQQMTAVVDPQTQMMMSKLLTAVQQSCEQDGWTAPLKTCILEAPDASDAMTACDKHVSPELRTKISERMMTVMQ